MASIQKRNRGHLRLFCCSAFVFALFVVGSLWRMRRLTKSFEAQSTPVSKLQHDDPSKLPAHVNTSQTQRRLPRAMFFEPCMCANPTEASAQHNRERCGPKGENMYPKMELPTGLALNATYLTLEDQIALLTELNQYPFQPYIGKDCLEFGMNFSFYVPKTTADTLPPQVAKLGQRLVRDGYLTDQPNYVLVNRYTAGNGIHPHVDDVYYTDSIAAVTLGSGAALNFVFDDFGPYFRKPDNKELLENRRQQFARGEMLQCFAGYFLPGAVFGMMGEARWGWKHEMQIRDSDSVARSAFKLLNGNQRDPSFAYRHTVARGLRYALTFRRVRDDVMDRRWRGLPVLPHAY